MVSVTKLYHLEQLQQALSQNRDVAEEVFRVQTLVLGEDHLTLAQTDDRLRIKLSKA